MRYAFVALTIVAIWTSITILSFVLDYSGIMLPILALVLTIIIFEIGIGGKAGTITPRTFN